MKTTITTTTPPTTMTTTTMMLLLLMMMMTMMMMMRMSNHWRPIKLRSSLYLQCALRWFLCRQFVGAAATDFLWSARRRCPDNLSARCQCHDDALDLLPAFSCCVALDRNRNRPNIMQLLLTSIFIEFFATWHPSFFGNAVSVWRHQFLVTSYYSRDV